VAGTSTSLLICALHQVLTSKLESQLSCIVRESYAQTRMTEVSNSSMGPCFSAFGEPSFLAADLDSRLTSPPWHHHRVAKGGWGVPLVMGLVPLILRKRGRGFLPLRDHSAWKSYFSLHLPEIDSANRGVVCPLVTSLIHPQAVLRIFHLLLRLVRGAGEEYSGFGVGDGDRFLPVECGQELVGAGELGLSD
jgi:hypothetical protein